MVGRNGQELLSTWISADQAAAFKAWARRTEGGASAALRRLIARAMDRAPPGPCGVGRGKQVSVRFKEDERLLLARAARDAGTTPANWVRSLALVHLARRPQWNEAEVEALRAVARELRAIGSNVNQIARALHEAPAKDRYPPDAAGLAEAAAERVRLEARRVVAVMTGNFDYWGLPDADRPSAAPGAMGRADADARAAEAKRRRRPRRRPARFGEE